MRRATFYCGFRGRWNPISIHALHEEGDKWSSVLDQPAPVISIHALHEEGDLQLRLSPHSATISIHALREEGDGFGWCRGCAHIYFYPRPPRGGRHGHLVESLTLRMISIHALREEGDQHTT